MQVTFYHRRPQKTNFSIERLFADVRTAMPEEVVAKVAVSRFPSRGIWGRVYNIVEAAFRQGDVNHITGDVHFLTFLLCRKNTLLTIHDMVSAYRLSGLRRRVFLFFWYWLPIRRSALITVISQSTKDDLLRHINVDPQKLRVVYNPVSAAFQPAPREFNDAKPVVLLIGTGQNKNVERVVEALNNVPCHLRLIGKLNAGQEAVLRKYGVEYSVTANISDEKVVEEYQRCDMLVFASTYEGFGLPIAEAQATGRPVVTSNIMSMPEVAGDAACLVDPLDVADIREGILKVINDPVYRGELVRRGFENAKQFQPEQIANEYLNLYRELAAADRECATPRNLAKRGTRGHVESSSISAKPRLPYPPVPLHESRPSQPDHL
ncbi:MAG: glycosyltransferase family 4 protein [Pirellulales bacterium]|nr:glycosyltransferase family 4 protein [Pirellulales bacterium]